MRIGIDVDSTLHHYWDQLAVVAKKRFGVVLPYDEQVTWSIQLLKPDQVRACIDETHRAENILAAKPYPGAVESVRAWHAAGHYIHVTSHRTLEAREATAQWLEAIGMPYDDLHCSWDKIARCRELGIDLLIDDSPVNLQRALDGGLLAATIEHPWNRELCEVEDIYCARDWHRLADVLAPVLETPRAA